MGESCGDYWHLVRDAQPAQVRGGPQDEGVQAVQRDALLHGGLVNHLGLGAGRARAGGHVTAEAACGRTLKMHQSFLLF